MRFQRSLQLAKDLLEAAEHPDITAVTLVGWEGVHASPCALKVDMVDGSSYYLQCVGSSGPGGTNFAIDEEVPFPDYQIPKEQVRLAWQASPTTAAALAAGKP